MMKVVPRRGKAPGWMVSGLMPQMLVVVFLCCFIVGVTIAVEQILIVAAKDISVVNLLLEVAIFGAAIAGGAVLTAISRREACGLSLLEP